MNEKYTQFSGVFVPREVLLDQDISANAKLIFAIVQSLDNDKGCYASNDYIGGMVGLSESSVRACLQALEEKKYIERFVFDGTSRILKTCTTQSFSAQPRQKSGDTPPENQRPPRQKSGTYSNRKKNIDINSILLPALPHGDAFAKMWEDWKAYRTECKKPLTSSSIREQLKFLSQQNEQDAITSIENSIRNGWSGLFATRPQGGKPSPRLLTSKDHEAF
jgi:DNA-binding Lrp family transcriptional regulator